MTYKDRTIFIIYIIPIILFILPLFVLDSNFNHGLINSTYFISQIFNYLINDNYNTKETLFETSDMFFLLGGLLFYTIFIVIFYCQFLFIQKQHKKDEDKKIYKIYHVTTTILCLFCIFSSLHNYIEYDKIKKFSKNKENMEIKIDKNRNIIIDEYITINENFDKKNDEFYSEIKFKNNIKISKLKEDAFFNYNKIIKKRYRNIRKIKNKIINIDGTEFIKINYNSNFFYFNEFIFINNNDIYLVSQINNKYINDTNKEIMKEFMKKSIKIGKK